MPHPPPAHNPLWQEPAPPGHAPPPPDARCGSCTWRYLAEALPEGSQVHCHRHPDGGPIQDDWPACAAWTGGLDCRACGACCGEAYHCVEVGRDEPFARDHRDLLVEDFGQLQLPRPGGRCVCLVGQAPALGCSLYAQRPVSCRDFPEGGRSCIDARRRCGLTP